MESHEVILEKKNRKLCQCIDFEFIHSTPHNYDPPKLLLNIKSFALGTMKMKPHSIASNQKSKSLQDLKQQEANKEG